MAKGTGTTATEAPTADELAKKERKRLKKERKAKEKAEKVAAKVNGSALGDDEKKERSPLSEKKYEKELKRLQVELVKLQFWVKHKGLKVVLIFEGRDAAGKGGTIKRITEGMNPRGCRVVALATPSDREKTQWYFQRYVAHLPSAGEIVIFDRSWYNRAGVERVMGFCTDAEHAEFMRACPEFERMLVRSGIILLKYWFSVSDEEQERRFVARLRDPMKRWKFSPMDVESRDRWVEYSKAKDEMLVHTNIPEAPWFTVDSDDKERARLNCMRHILVKVPYEELPPDTVELTPRKPAGSYVRPPRSEQFYVPQYY
ncbi:MAG: polyphosphate kinase 2 [Sandaracinus sp.]